MKVTTDHYTAIKEAIFNLGIDKIKAYQLECKEKGFSQTRFIWDLFHYSNVIRSEAGQSKEFRAYFDSHLDTAITKAVKEILLNEYKY